jgi:hypothetical protein
MQIQDSPPEFCFHLLADLRSNDVPTDAISVATSQNKSSKNN